MECIGNIFLTDFLKYEGILNDIIIRLKKYFVPLQKNNDDKTNYIGY